MFLIIGKIAIVKLFAESHQHSRKRGKGMEKQEKNTVTPYDLDGRPPLKLAIPLGLQHVLAMFVGNLTPLLIITAACGIEAGGELQVALLQNAMLIAGIVTLVQVFTIGPVGGKPPSLWEPVPVLLAYARVLQESWVMEWLRMVQLWRHPLSAVFLKLYWEAS